MSGADVSESTRRAYELGRTDPKIREAVDNAPPLDAATLAHLRELIPPLGNGQRP